MRSVRRRDLLAAAGGVAAMAAMPRIGLAQDAADLRATPLADDLIMVSGAGANMIAGADSDGLLLVDGGLAAHAAALLDFIQRETGESRARALFNTSWRPGHTGLNGILGPAGTPILAHENTRLWLTQTIEPPYEERVYRPLPEQARPSRTFYQEESLAFADGEAHARYVLQAHTDGDIIVHFPQRNVIAAGGVLVTDRWPEIDWWTGGWMGVGRSPSLNTVLIPTYGGMVGGLQALLALSDDETRIVPAYGPVATRAQVEAQVAMYAELGTALRDMLFQSMGPEDVLEAGLLDGQHPEWGSPDRFLVRAFESLWPHLTPDS